MDGKSSFRGAEVRLREDSEEELELMSKAAMVTGTWINGDGNLEKKDKRNLSCRDIENGKNK